MGTGMLIALSEGKKRNPQCRQPKNTKVKQQVIISRDTQNQGPFLHRSAVARALTG